MKIIEFDPKYTEEIYDFVMDIKANEIGWKSDAYELRDIPKYYLGGGGNFWIALDDDKIIGTTALENMGNGQGYLKRMYLTKEYRGTGVAQEMLSVLLQYARDRQIKEIYLATGTNPNVERAIAFYDKMGFEKIMEMPENFYNEDCDVFMKLEI